MLNENDKKRLSKKGISEKQLEEQISCFVKGFPPLDITRPATVNDGIFRLSSAEVQDYINLYQRESKNKKVMKFVPASGAATRMFKDLFYFLEKPDIPNLSAGEFIEKLEKFAFYPALKELFEKEGKKIEEASAAGIIEKLLKAGGLNYGQLPKGLLLFHSYKNAAARKALEEHLVEGILYGKGKNDGVNIHFTVSPEHKAFFESEAESRKQELEKGNGVKIDITFSEQLPYTDTVAVNLQNEPLRDDAGNLIFRPGGHGALIENLNDIDADVIFIKNVDNVVPDHLKQPTTEYKKALAGLLIDLQNKIFKAIQSIDDKTFKLPGLENLLKELCFEFPSDCYEKSSEEKVAYIRKALCRPLRVCGMVKNEGEPGGGPFWVKSGDGSQVLQIVESAQIDMNDAKKLAIFKASSHFNPVDLVCATKNHKGEKYRLPDYVDKNTGFISEKSLSGRILKALELPGLWNGAMADWNTVFVEVPAETFNPVKTVNDLLRPAHQ